MLNVLKKLLCLIILISLNYTSAVIACDIHGHSGFLPKNNLTIPAGLKFIGGGLNENQFNQVMDKISALYSGMVAAQGRKLIIDRRWTDPTVNAFAEQNTTGIDTIHMFGGLARHPEVTPDAMALVACHELGHHLGGAPKKVAGDWAANEGQADYWGAMKCLRHYFEGDNQQQALQGMDIPSLVKTKCTAQYANNDEQLICQRSAMAGLALGKLLSVVTKDTTISSYETPDKSVVAKTFDDHPKTQCRLDTFLNASLCDHTIRDTGSYTDANTGVCSVRNGDLVGNRPLCWFRP
jgi:hypothetical protein